MGFNFTGFKDTKFPLLVKKLQEIYGEDHQLTHYIAPQFSIVDPRIDRWTIRQLWDPAVQKKINGALARCWQWIIADSTNILCDYVTMSIYGIDLFSIYTDDDKVMVQNDALLDFFGSNRAIFSISVYMSPSFGVVGKASRNFLGRPGCPLGVSSSTGWLNRIRHSMGGP